MDEKKEPQYSYDNGMRPKEWNFPNNFNFYPDNFFFKLLQNIAYILALFWLYLYVKIKYHFKVVNKYNLKQAKKLMKKDGVVFTSNHVFPFDAISILAVLAPHKVYIPMLQSNMGFGIASKTMRLGGAVPIPKDLENFKKFDKATHTALNEKKSLLFMIEGSLILFSGHIRPFQRGAIKYAHSNNKKIVPLCFTFHRHSQKKKGNKPYIKLNVLPIYEIKDKDLKEVTKELNEMVANYFVLNSDDCFLDEEGIALKNSLK